MIKKELGVISIIVGLVCLFIAGGLVDGTGTMVQLNIVLLLSATNIILGLIALKSGGVI